MNTDHPTVELYFIAACTYCKLRVYKEDENFVREVLKHSGVCEWLDPDASKSWQEIDTRVLLGLTRAALPKMVGGKLKAALVAMSF